MSIINDLYINWKEVIITAEAKQSFRRNRAFYNGNFGENKIDIINNNEAILALIQLDDASSTYYPSWQKAVFHYYPDGRYYIEFYEQLWAMEQGAAPFIREGQLENYPPTEEA